MDAQAQDHTHNLHAAASTTSSYQNNTQYLHGNQPPTCFSKASTLVSTVDLLNVAVYANFGCQPLVSNMNSKLD
jgi:hypothetical protein